MNDETITRKVLDNGLTALIRENSGDPLAALQIWVKTGSINEGARLGSGISHYIEHMLFKGTATHPAGEIARQVKSLGGQINAYTSHESTVYLVMLPQSNLEAVLGIMADAVFNSSFDPGECEREKQVILKEINMNDDDPGRYISRLFSSVIYRRLPFRYPVIGYRQMVSSLNREDLLDYYRGHYVPQNMTVVIAGGVDAGQAMAAVERLFSSYPRRPTPPLIVPDEPPAGIPKRVVQDFALRVSRLKIGFPTVSIHQPELYALDILAIVMGQGKSSRFYRRLKEELGLVYDVGCSSYTPGYQGYFSIDAELDYDHLSRVEEVLWREIEFIRKGDIGHAELERARNRVVCDFLLQQESVENQARVLGSDEVLVGDHTFSAHYLERIRQVTVAQLMAASNRFFQKDVQTLVVLRPKQAEKVGPPAAREPLHGKLLKQTLANGLTLLTQPRPRLPLMALALILRGGLYYETSRDNGVFNFVQRALLKGTKNFSGEEIARKLEAVGGRVDCSSGINAVVCQMLVQQKDVTLGLELLADLVFRPVFPAGELDKVRREILADIRTQEDTPLGMGRQILMKTLFAPHPYGLPLLGAPEIIATLHREDLIQAHTRFYNPQNMVLSVCGDMQSERTRELAHTYFGGAKGVPLTFPEVPAAVFPDRIKQIRTPLAKAQTVLFLGYPGIKSTHPDRYAFQVLAQIMSGLGSRVVENLRERRGLAYYAGALQFAGLDTGAFVFYVGTTAEKVKEAQAGLLEEIERMRIEPVDREELDRAQQAIIGKQWIDRQSSSNFALEAAADEISGLGFDEVYKSEQGIRRVSREDLLRLARDYFTADRYVAAIAGALPLDD